MGGIGNVVVNTVVRTFTRKAVGKVMKTARPASGKSKKGGPKKVPQGSSKAPRELAGSR